MVFDSYDKGEDYLLEYYRKSDVTAKKKVHGCNSDKNLIFKL